MYNKIDVPKKLKQLVIWNRGVPFLLPVLLKMEVTLPVNVHESKCKCHCNCLPFLLG